VIYLDSSAVLKLVYEEAESAALADWLTARAGTPVLSSELAKIEVVRACRRLDAAALPTATALLAGLDLMAISGPVIDRACDLGEPLLRSLDAIHLASALTLREDLEAFVAYDLRLTSAAASAGLEPLTPGR
jgi:uncharacterized protein